MSEDLGLKKDKHQKKFGKFFEKLKAIKHIEIIIAVIFVAIVLLIYLSSGSVGIFGSQKKSEVVEEDTLTITEYARDLEEKIVAVLSSIKGAGKVSVMLNFEHSSELKIAYTTETVTKKENAIETTTVTQSPVLVTNDNQTSPIVLQETIPKPKNIIVIASGANDVDVRLELTRAVESLLNLPSSAIQIFMGN